jgi:hypothetical protein
MHITSLLPGGAQHITCVHRPWLAAGGWPACAACLLAAARLSGCCWLAGCWLTGWAGALAVASGSEVRWAGCSAAAQPAKSHRQSASSYFPSLAPCSHSPQDWHGGMAVAFHLRCTQEHSVARSQCCAMCGSGAPPSCLPVGRCLAAYLVRLLLLRLPRWLVCGSSTFCRLPVCA